MSLSNEQLQAVVDAFHSAGGNKAEAARNLDMHVNTFKERLSAATRLNMLGDAFGGEVPEGYVLGKITQLHKSEDGKVMEWRHLTPEARQEAFLKAIEEWASSAIKPLDEAPLPAVTLSNLAVVYPIPDVHFGQYSWGKETGNAYDLDIARQTVLTTFGRLVKLAPAATHAVVLGLGDYFHADGNDARTPKSQNALDVDSRFGKVQWMGAELLIEVVDLALQKHDHVTVKVLAGNHDPRAQDALTIALWFRYANNPRVTVDRKPGLFWFWQWGKTMIGAHHGHEAKLEAMPGIMAAYEPEMWGATLYRYAYQGHIHKRTKLVEERGGVVAETFQAIAAKDAWNRGKGHASGRSVAAIVLDKAKGEVIRRYEPIAP